MKKLLLMIFILALTIQTQAVQLTDLDLKTKNNLLKQFPNIEKNNFSKSELDQVIRWLVTHEQFESAYYYFDADARVTKIKTGSTRRLKNMKILGVSQISEAEARSQLPVSENTVFDQSQFLEAVENLRLYYRELGYYSTSIDVEFQNTDENQVQATIKINEGIRTNIGSIIFHTTNTDLKMNLEGVTKSLIHSAYNNSSIIDLKKEIRNFFAENRYFKAEVSEPQVTISKDEKFASLVFEIKNPDEYLVEVVDDEEEEIIKKTLSTIGLSHFISTNPNIPQEIASRAKNYLISQGYAKAEVKGDEDHGLSPFTKKIRLNIQAGPQVKIEKIEVSGRLSQSPLFYSEFIRKNSSSIIEKGFYVRDDLETGFKNLIIDRQNNGFLKATKISHRAIYNKDGNQVSISINFDEGPLTQIQKITFEGNDALTEAQLLDLLDLKQMEPLRLNKLEAALSRIKSYYLDHGYLEMNITNEKDDLVNYNEDNTLAHIKLKITEGPKVVVGSIVVEGNTITLDYVVLKEVDFSIDDTLTPSKIEDSITRLQRLGIFSSVNIRTLEAKTMLSRRTVLISVTDRDPGIRNIGIGVTNERTTTFRGFAGIAYKNLFGRAHVASARLDANYNATELQFVEYKLSALYLYPYLLDSKVKLLTNFTQSRYISDFNNRLVTNTQQGSITFERDITTRIFVSYDLWTKALYQDYSINPTNPYSNNLEIGSTSLSTQFDYRDHPFNPRRGFLARLSTEYGSPFFQSSRFITYSRNLATLSAYLPLGERSSWANSIRGGHVKNLQSDLSDGTIAYTPYDKKGFILGGQTTIRGFTPAEAFPNSTDLGAVQYQLKTEASMFLFKSELRFPIWGDIGGAVFYDAGIVNIPGFNIPYRHSAGISARFNTPVGPVSLEMGWKLNMQSSRNESPTALHLSIGAF